MQIVDIASKIIDTKDVDIYYDDSSIEFSSVLYLKKEFDKKRGLYFPKCDSLEVLEYYKNHYPINYFHIKGKITLVCNFNDISFSVFAMLHELGHWRIYKKFIEEGHNDEDYIKHYELRRAELIYFRNLEYDNCKDKEEWDEIGEKYSKMYLSLPTERKADQFAFEYLQECMLKLNEN